MAGTILMRRERDGLFHARPQFSCPGMRIESPKPEGVGNTPLLAFEDLLPKMPENIQMKMCAVDRWDFYQAPEYIDYRDRCVDIDRHRPSQTEWANRRARFITEVRLGHVESSWSQEALMQLK